MEGQAVNYDPVQVAVGLVKRGQADKITVGNVTVRRDGKNVRIETKEDK